MLLAAAVALWADGRLRRSGPGPTFYQEEFAPAVMFACGKGFHNVDWVNRDPALAAFLLQRRDALSCGELATSPPIPRNSFQRISVYLELAVGLTWRLTGVSWSAVVWLNALLAAFFAAALYGVMRLGMSPPVATIVSAVVLTSPLHLTYLPQLRDYSKAPFLLALVLLMGVAVNRALPRRRLLWLAVAAGVVEGIGFGFRSDLLLMMAPLLAVLLVFRAATPATPWRPRLIEGVTASAVFLASFALTAAPVFRGYARGGNLAHVILLGFTTPFNSALGVEAKHYELSARYDDGFQVTAVRSHAERVGGNGRLFSMGSEEYDRESNRYLIDVIQTFPADVAIRAVSSVARIVRAPFSQSYTPAPAWVGMGSLGRIYARRADLLDRAGWLGWAASAAVVAGIAAWRMRCAVFLLCLIVVLCGGAAIQFDPRHFFYLEFMSWWAVGVVVDRVWLGGRAIPQLIADGRWQTREWLARSGAGAARSAALVVACLLGTAAVLGATRHYQQRGMNRVFERALSSAGPPLRVTQAPDGADGVRVTFELPELELSQESSPTRSIGTAYLVIDVDPGRCDPLVFAALARYQTTADGVDFTTPVTVPLVDPHLGSSVKILLPVYSALFPGVPPTRFVGMELRSGHAHCIASIRKIENLSVLPVLVSAVLGPDWRTALHYQTMTGVEEREDGIPFHVRVYPTLHELDVHRSRISQLTTSTWRGASITSRGAAPSEGSGMVIDGSPDSQYAYLLWSPERAVARGTCAIADGELTAGGLTFGLLRNDQWDQQVNIIEHGRFIAAACVLQDGSYSIVLANDNPNGRVTKARLARIGWVGADAERQAVPAAAMAVATEP